VITKENAEDFGINPEFMGEDEEIVVFDALELPTDENDELAVWESAPETDGDFTAAQVLEIAEGTKGIGKKSLARLAENLEEAR
jgi:hypothetical protein